MFKSIFSKLFKKDKQEQEEISLNLKFETEVVATKFHISEPVSSEYQINFEKRLIERVKNALNEYPFIKKEKMSFLANELIYNQLKHSKNILSLEEKRALNLNTRAKYLKEIIECFIDVEHLDFDPKGFCENLLHTERSILWSLDKIEEAKQIDFVKKVSLEGKGKWDNQTYDIDNIPPMEKVDYTEERVLFFVIPKVDFDDPLDKQ